MSKLLDSQNFGEKLFQTLPTVYKREDKKYRHALERYLKSLADGGFKYNIEEINGLLDLNDPEKTPYNVLMVLYRQYGLEMFHGIPEIYLRKLLPIIGDLYSAKGSISAIEYITGIISDVKTTIELGEDFYNDFHIDITLDMNFDKKDKRDFPTEEQLLRIINEFVPFFFDVTIIILDNYNDFVGFSMQDDNEDYLDTYKKTILVNTTNVENKKLNKTAYLNNSDFEKNVFLENSDYAKDEIYENGNLIETIEY